MVHRRLSVGLAAALVACLALTQSPAGAETPERDLRIAGRLPVLWPTGLPAPKDLQIPSGQLILNASTRRAYQIFSGYTRTVIQSFDLDTLQPLQTRELVGAPATVAAESGEFLHAVDGKNGRLIFGWGPDQSGNGSPFQEILMIDEGAFEDGRPFERRLPIVPRIDLPGGLSYFETDGRGKVLILAEGVTAALEAGLGIPYPVYPHYLTQWDIEPGGGVDWIHPLPLCSRAPLFAEKTSRNLTLGLFRSLKRSSIYLVCQSAPRVGQVLRVNLGPDGNPNDNDEAFPGPVSVLDAMPDPVGDRLLLRAQTTSEGIAWWIFDGGKSGYVGVVGLTPVSSNLFGQGLDPATGRAYALLPALEESGDATVRDPGGLVLADARRTPPPQALAFPELASFGRTRIVVDPVHGKHPTRVFVRQTSGDQQDRGASYYLVVEDRVPVLGDPPTKDVDENTTEVAEKEGATGRNFLGAGSGYGLRLLLVAGLKAVSPTGDQLQSPCWRTDRVLSFGAVQNVALSGVTASARAASATADASTIEDLAKPSSRCWPAILPSGSPPTVDDALGRRWSFQPIECAQPGKKAAPKPSAFDDSTASVECDPSHERVTALGSFVGETEGPVTIAHAWSTATSRRDPKRGVVVTVESAAEGIEIADVGRIRLVRTRTESWANGRRHGAGTDAWNAQARTVRLRREVCGVRVGSFVREPCGDPAPVVAALNRALGYRGRAELSEPDPTFAAGSPGGYLSSVQKETILYIADAQFNNDTSTEVSGLRLIFFNDAGGRARQIYDFAGVAASTTYGIFLLPKAVAGPEIPENTTTVVDVPGESSPVVDGGGGPARAVPTAVPPKITRTPASGLAVLLASPSLLQVTLWFLLGLPAYFAIRRERLARARSGGGV